MLDRLKVKSSFINGLRITDQETMSIVEMVLSGSINKELVGGINKEVHKRLAYRVKMHF